MKLTTDTIRRLIKEELEAVLEAITGRTIYAPGPVGTYMPKEKGSRIDYDRDPFLELDPDIQKRFPKGSRSGSELQAYELQRAMDPDFGQEDYPDFTGMSPEEIEIHKEKAEQRAEEEFLQGVERQGEHFLHKQHEMIDNNLKRVERQLKRAKKAKLPKEEIEALKKEYSRWALAQTKMAVYGMADPYHKDTPKYYEPWSPERDK